jgi:hypothetical protein
MNITVKGAPSRESLQLIQDAIKDLGLNSELATAGNQEYMYLMKQGRMIPNNKRGLWNDMIARHAVEDLSIQKRVDEMVQYWDTALKADLKKAKVKTIRDLPYYQPEGVWETHYKTGEKIGEKVYYRFDVSPEQWAKDQKRLQLYHDPAYGRGTKVADFLDKALGGTPNLLSNDAKLMKGIPIYGGSPIEDMRSGGTNYAFTRWMPKQDRSHRGIFFKNDLGRRLDSISYDHDAYGKVTGDYANLHMINAKPNGVGDQFRMSRRTGGNGISFNWSNETLFKGEVNILNHLDRLVVRTEDEIRRCLDVFKKYGIDRLPDGRKVKDIIQLWDFDNTGVTFDF